MLCLHICTIAQYTSITGTWQDDFSDDSPLPGWSYTDSHSINSNDPYTYGSTEYHGPYIGQSPGGTTYLFTIEREFKCTTASSVSVTYNFYGCDTGAADFTRLILDGTTYSVAGNTYKSSHSDATLNAATPSCSAWKEFGPLPTYTISSVAADELFTVRFQSKVTNYDEAMAISSIQITCNTFPTTSTTSNPTQNPIKNPTINPTSIPTQNPVKNPTVSPTQNPSRNPTKNPTKNPTYIPTQNPSKNPTKNPTQNPTQNPSKHPTTSSPITASPTSYPTPSPTSNPTPSPTDNPTPSPTDNPTPSPTDNPTPSPTDIPTASGYLTTYPTDSTNSPTPSPSNIPTPSPTDNPTPSPTYNPTPSPSNIPTPSPTDNPSPSPTENPLGALDPTYPPTTMTKEPSVSPTVITTKQPTIIPTIKHSEKPSQRLSITSRPSTIISINNPTASPINSAIKPSSYTDPKTDSETVSFLDTFMDKLIIILSLLVTICCMAFIITIIRNRKRNEKPNKSDEANNSTKDRTTDIVRGTTVNPLTLTKQIGIKSNSRSISIKIKAKLYNRGPFGDVLMDKSPNDYDHVQMSKFNGECSQITPPHDEIEDVYDLEIEKQNNYGHENGKFLKNKIGNDGNKKHHLAVYKMEGVEDALPVTPYDDGDGDQYITPNIPDNNSYNGLNVARNQSVNNATTTGFNQDDDDDDDDDYDGDETKPNMIIMPRRVAMESIKVKVLPNLPETPIIEKGNEFNSELIDIQNNYDDMMNGNEAINH